MLKSNVPNRYPIRNDAQTRNRRASPTRHRPRRRFHIKNFCAKRSGLPPPRGPASSAVNRSERLLMNDYTTNARVINRTKVTIHRRIRLQSLLQENWHHSSQFGPTLCCSEHTRLLAAPPLFSVRRRRSQADPSDAWKLSNLFLLSIPGASVGI